MTELQIAALRQLAAALDACRAQEIYVCSELRQGSGVMHLNFGFDDSCDDTLSSEDILRFIAREQMP